MARPLFVDTNVWVYRSDPSEPSKSASAAAVLDALAAADVPLVVSAQVLSEFANVFTRRLARVLPEPLAVAITRLAAEASYVFVTPTVVAHAIDGVRRFGFSFYDAQIWAAATEFGAAVVLSEDFSDGMIADGVRFANPFAPGFDVNDLVTELGRL
jgi:predicted nucleic acid-binding protein